MKCINKEVRIYLRQSNRTSVRRWPWQVMMVPFATPLQHFMCPWIALNGQSSILVRDMLTTKDFIAPYGSLPHSQAPATCPCPEPDKSRPCSPSHFLKIHLNIIFLSKSGSFKWSLSLRFPHQNTVYATTVPHTRYMPRPPHSSRFYHPNNIEWAVQIIKLLFM